MTLRNYSLTRWLTKGQSIRGKGQNFWAQTTQCPKTNGYEAKAKMLTSIPAWVCSLNISGYYNIIKLTYLLLFIEHISPFSTRYTPCSW